MSKDTIEIANSLLAEKAALEARVKELEADCNRYSENLQYHITRQGEAEAELARRDAQEPIGKVVLGDYDDCGNHPEAKVVCLHESAHWNNFPDGYKLYAEPRPAVLSPDIGAVIGRLNKGYFARWVKAYENPLEPEGFVGGSVRVSDLVKLFNFAIGYQSQRFVVTDDFLHTIVITLCTDRSISEKIKDLRKLLNHGAGGEIAE